MTSLKELSEYATRMKGTGSSPCYVQTEDLLTLLSALEKYEEALKYAIGAMKNEMVANGLPLEWSPNSGIGVATNALTQVQKIMEGK